MSMRTIKRIVTGSIQYDGAGVKLVRVIGGNDVNDFDPFLMLDAFDSENPEDYSKGFPWHPHRGIETVTYLIQGNIEHEDSLGNRGAIVDGCCQWMTAGSGILHQEMPKASERMLGAQLWVNLPRTDKMTKPQYRDLQADQIPEINKDGATVRVISGHYNGVEGATQGEYVKVQYLDVSLEPEATFHLPTDPTHTAFAYLVQGTGTFGDENEMQRERRALLFNEGDSVKVQAGENGLRFLLLSAAPLKEPVAWGGPIVMNTREELLQAFHELETGDFIKG